MEKYVKWFLLLEKETIRRKGFWIQIFAIFFLLFLISQVHMPGEENNRAGVFLGGSQKAGEILLYLQKEDSLFDFQEYENKDALEQDVVSGKVECGFFFPEDFDLQMQEGIEEGSILYLCTPLSTKGEVMKETFYSALFYFYSDTILKQCEQEVFGEEDAEKSRLLLEQNHKNQKDAPSLHVKIEEAAAKKAEHAVDSKVYPIQGMAGLFVFLTMFLSYIRRFEPDRKAILQFLPVLERRLFLYLDVAAAGIIPGLIGLGAIWMSADNRGALLELFYMIFLVIVSGAWILLVGSMAKSSDMLLSFILGFVAATLVLCPVFIDISSYIPAAAYVRRLLPVGMYL